MYERDEIVKLVQSLDGERYLIVHSDTSQVLGVSEWNQYGDMKQVFDSAEEVADAWFELGLHEMTEEERGEYEVVSVGELIVL